MTKHPWYQVLVVGLCMTGWTAAESRAGTVSPIQSTARPLRLNIAGPVMLAGSDERSAAFQANALPQLNAYVTSSLNEKQSVANLSAIALNPGQLKLDYDANVRVYFVGEGAGYRNTLGFFTTDYDADAGGLAATDARLVFPNVTSSTSYMDGSTSSNRTASAPLQPGDFVSLGTLTQGTTLTPFLIADGAGGGTRVYTPFADQNPDGIQHFVALSIGLIADVPYLLIGVEDLLGGGDLDFNDAVFALDIGAINIERLVTATAPLPSAALALAGPIIWGVLAAFRRRRQPIAGTAA